MTTENLKKIVKLSVALATSIFQELFAIKFDSKSSQFEIKIFLLKELVTKNRAGTKMPLPARVKECHHLIFRSIETKQSTCFSVPA